MALLVNENYDTEIGTTISSSYWRWVAIGVDILSQQIILTLRGYVSESAFNSGKQSIGQKVYRATEANYFTAATAMDGPDPVGLSEAIYDYVIANDEFFSDATYIE
jgi:hypothetical protein